MSPHPSRHDEPLQQIELRLALSFTALLAGMMVLILLAGTAMYARIEARQRDRLVRLVGEMLAESMQGVNSAGKYRTRWTVERLVHENPTLRYVSVVDNAGWITAHSDPGRNDTPVDAETRDLVAESIQAGRPLTRIRRIDDQQVTEVIHPLHGGYEEAIVGAVCCGVETSSLQQTLLAGALPISGLLLFLMGLSMPAVTLLSRHLGAPIRRQAAELRAILEHAPLVVAIHDRDGRLFRTSRRFDELFGKDATSRPRIQELLPVQADPPHGVEPEGRELSLSLDGTRRRFFASHFPLGSDPGDPPDLLCLLAADVTDLRAASAERDRLAAAVEQAVDLVALVDPSGHLRYTNPAFSLMTGVSAEEARNGDPWRLLGGTPEQRQQQQAALAAGRPWRGRVEISRPDGGSFPCSLVVSPITSPAGEGMGVVILGRDVSAEESLQAQLRQAQKMEIMGRLAGGVAHDFNNLLTVLIGRSEMLLDEVLPGSTWARELRVILDTSYKAADLTARLLAVSRRQVQRTELLDLGVVVDEMLPMLTRVLGEDIDLVHLRSDDLWTVAADRSQLEQVLLNLAVNARDAMPGGGRLVVETCNRHIPDDPHPGHPQASMSDPRGRAASTRYIAALPPGDYATLVVSDNGSGIPADVQEQMFEPFFTTKEAGKGTGLGLTMVAGIVHQSAGHIRVYSEPGVGTSFRVYLPRRDSLERSAGLAPTEPAEQPVGGRGELVLLVEDDEEVRATLSRLLRGAGYQTLQVDGAESALAILERTTPDVLLTDVVMPGMHGTELARRVREGNADLPIILMSGYSEHLVTEPGELGDLELVGKPPARHTLLGALRRALDRRTNAS